MLLPVFVHLPAAPASSWHEEMLMFTANTNFELHPVGSPPLDAEKLELIDHVHGRQMEAAPFMSAAEFLTDARRSFNRHGDARSTAISAALACEVLLDELLCCLLWEEGERPEDWSSYFDTTTLLDRVRSNAYLARIRGDWRLNGSGPIATWFSDVRGLRNRLLHSRYVPTINEARSALQGAHDLVSFLERRLGASVPAYTRTAFMLGGENAFSKSAARGHLHPLQRSPKEPIWTESARRWQDIMSRGRRDGEWSLGDPLIDECAVLAVKHATGELRYVMLHQASERAATVAEPEMSVPQKDFVRLLQPPDDVPAVSAKLMGVAVPSQRGPWVASYRLTPMRSVMVTGERFD